MLQASLRADAADLAYLPASGRWGYFPAVSAGWTISEENFFEPLKDVVSNMKLRASWGQNGTIRIMPCSERSGNKCANLVFAINTKKSNANNVGESSITKAEL